ncbi:unnamed protein product, partial [Ectocarpus sp. 12 AP-2014]
SSIIGGSSRSRRSAPNMKRSIATIFYCACWALRDSSSLLIAGSKYSSFSATGGDRRMTAARGPTRAQRRPPTTAVMTATEPNHTRSAWVRSVASAVSALLVLVCASVTAPLDAAAASASAQQPLVEALVQLADEEVDWTKLLPDPGQAPGASMIITASKERGGKPSLGASVAMDRLKFPVMMQLFPRNAVGGASWPRDFEEQGTYSVEVRDVLRLKHSFSI